MFLWRIFCHFLQMWCLLIPACRSGHYIYPGQLVCFSFYYSTVHLCYCVSEFTIICHKCLSTANSLQVLIIRSWSIKLKFLYLSYILCIEDYWSFLLHLFVTDWIFFCSSSSSLLFHLSSNACIRLRSFPQYCYHARPQITSHLSTTWNFRFMYKPLA